MKTIKKFAQSVLGVMALGALVFTGSARAEDIDIYMDNSADGDLPNVLFVIDNSSNLGSTWGGGGCAGYADGSGAPSLGTNTAGGVIQCSLVDTINGLPNDRLKVGIMSGNANGFGTSKGCVGNDGGCLLYALTTVNAANRPALITFIKAWKKENSGETPTSFPFTVTSAPAGGMMQESWAYYNGRTGLSGRTYSGSILQACQKNFIIYIGNTDKTPANEDLSGPTALAAAGASTSLRNKIIAPNPLKFDPPICGPKNIGQIAVGSNANDWSSNWGDEWARLMLKQDGGTDVMEGSQNITTYTIGIIDNASNQCTADYPALLQSMAVNGGGKPYRVSDAGEVKKALAEALNEVQAVNSVFSSASLPVSVNAEGSYLNQIFLGMFRPDATGSPRWLGNLKQYQLFRNNTGQLVMGDATLCADGTTYCPKSAISSGGTGFLSPNALSFWTYRDTSVLPDSVGGFFLNEPKGQPASTYDYPPTTAEGLVGGDGEVVEKGGVAQQLRKQNVVATFSGGSGTSGNPRRLYTYCPDDAASCPTDLAHADNDFSTTNAKIPAAAFGSTLTIPITSIARSGTTITVTTSGSHGFRTGSVVTIRNVAETVFNLTKAVTVLNATQFTVAGIPDLPSAPTTVAYTVSIPGGTSITSMSRATTGASTDVMTVNTATPHGYLPGTVVQISGVAPAEFNGNWTVVDAPTPNQFRFNIPVFPNASALNTYAVVHSPRSIPVSSITASGGVYTVATSADHLFHVGQMVTISGIKGGFRNDYNTTHEITSVPTARSFVIRPPAGSPGNATTGSVSPSTTPQLVKPTRTNSVVANAAAVTGVQAKWFANGDEVDVTISSGTFAGEGTSGGPGSYVVSKARITCSGDCSNFTYPITVSPAATGTSFGTVGLPGSGAGSATIAAGNITRLPADPKTARVTGVTGGIFLNGGTVAISPASGSVLDTESAYVGTWQNIACSDASCSSFTFGPVNATPVSGTGTNMQAYSGSTSPDKDVLIKWLRGEDNHGDEKGPGNTVTVRPSVHGDVLHSRPLVINYGDARGIVVFYGSNDGVYRAVNGNQRNAITGTIGASSVTVPAGGELWGLILPDHYQLINRYRTNSPELKFPGTFLSTAQPKDYFVDGPTGVYQKLNADGSINKAIIYLTMRRGGRFIYAIDVTQPLSPRYVWSKSHQDTGFEELGQTWSRPRLTLLQSYKDASNVPIPVLVFGAGYDPAQDAEPPTGDTMGRGIFVVNALDGSKVFSASSSCPDNTADCRKHTAMKYATPADIAFVDRDLDGFTDKFYWGDLGGNVWRADVAKVDPAEWTVNRVAKLGCNVGECPFGTTPRKFFFPPSVLTVRPSGATGSYEALSMVSGDREHPLRDAANANSAFNVTDRFFMVKDLGTSVTDLTLNTVDVTASTTDLYDATYALWDGTRKGFFINFIGAGWNESTDQPDPARTPTKGEKAVNAPTAVNGQIFFATNQPKDKTNTCVANLGTARAYAINPFTGRQIQNELAGGGLPPSAVSGLITIVDRDANGNPVETQEKFCIGCGVTAGDGSGGDSGAPCTSALENCPTGALIPKNLKRTYWYKK